MTTVKENRSYRYNLGIRPADLHGILCLQRAKTSAVGIKSEFKPFLGSPNTAFCRFCDFNGQNMVIESYILMFQEQCKINSMTPEEKSVHSSHKIKGSTLAIYDSRDRKALSKSNFRLSHGPESVKCMTSESENASQSHILVF